MRIPWLILGLGLLALSGCAQGGEEKAGQPAISDAAPQPLVEMIDSPQLARMILKPVKKELPVSRDPFAPLINPKKEKVTAPAAVRDAAQIEDLSFLGVVRIDEEYLALLADRFEKGVYRVNDTIKGFTIVDIQTEEVTFSNSVRTIKIKRGDIQ